MDIVRNDSRYEISMQELEFLKELFDIQMSAFSFLSISETIAVPLASETGSCLQFREWLCEPLEGTGG